MVEITGVQNTFLIYEDNQGAIFLANNRQVGIRKKHIDILYHYMRDMVEDNDVGIHYICSEDNPADIMTKNTSEAYFARNTKRSTEGELW